MQVNHRFRSLLAGVALLAWTGLASAQEVPLDMSTPAQAYAQRAMPLMLAANDSVVIADRKPATAAPAAQPEFEPPLLSGSNMHLALGLATVAAAVATAMTGPEGCESNCVGPQPPRETNGTHAKLGKTTAVLAIATVASGLITHWDDFHLEDGLTDPDNLHVILGVTGAALMAYAVNKSANSTTPVSHAGIAELGALGMIIGIKMTW
ncbi:MAG: hypothetical protein Q8O64_08870 [Sideroxyarcus sp.]|nr:hypothetical protein [Sideroxyarcus sp.]